MPDDAKDRLAAASEEALREVPTGGISGVAREADLHQSTLSKIQHGHERPSLDTVRRLADALATRAWRCRRAERILREAVREVEQERESGEGSDRCVTERTR